MRIPSGGEIQKFLDSQAKTAGCSPLNYRDSVRVFENLLAQAAPTANSSRGGDQFGDLSQSSTNMGENLMV